jgi:hypothetical protein
MFIKSATVPVISRNVSHFHFIDLSQVTGGEGMKTLALSLAIGAATFVGATAVNAAPAQTQTQTPIASHSDSAVQATDMSSHRRHWRRWHRHHHWGYRPYYRSYGYYQRPYYNPGPAISFGFGGGPRWHHRHYW